MPKVSFSYDDPTIARTVFYDKICAAIRSHGWYVEDPAQADVIFPAEDTALETNWPRYARPDTAFIRGQLDTDAHKAYLDRLKNPEKPLCIVNMHPFVRVPLMMAEEPAITVADINLTHWERAANPNTISMPALPITTGTFDPTAKQVLASFRGVNSHPCREALAGIGNGHSIVVEMVERTNHFGKIDAENKVFDTAYQDLMNSSLFAFVPRGEAEFSYRLLEVMSFGCIPVILADGLIPPFDRSVVWDDLSLQVPENRIGDIPTILAGIPAGRVAAMQRNVVTAYQRYFDGIPAVVSALLQEWATIVSTRNDEAPVHPEAVRRVQRVILRRSEQPRSDAETGPRRSFARAARDFLGALTQPRS